jgi:hypothetical protein
MIARLGILLCLILTTLPLIAQEKAPSERWEKDIQAFEAADKQSPPPKDPVLFIGASGIKRWTTLASDFPEYPMINRGFGGSQTIDSVYYADRIVIPYKPRLILLQTGGNDINAGKSPEEVAGDFQKFVEKVRAALPDVKIAFMSLQPSPARFTQVDKQKQANQLIQKYIAQGKNLIYIESFDAFLRPDGTPREELFVADRLHHNAEGYKVRVQLVQPVLAAALGGAAPSTSSAPVETKSSEPITQGQRIFFTGHSFHVFIPPILKNIAESAGIADQKQLGLSSIGGSRVYQHWNVADDKNQAKTVLKTGEIDVLTLAPIFMPDDGIEKFATLALEHNPKIRITVQEIWLRRDVYEPTTKVLPKTVDHNAITGAELRERHAPLFQTIDAHVSELNQKFGKQVLFVVPTGQAVIALRERIIAGKAGGLKAQSELFTDITGHGTKPLQVLVAYCHFAVIYRRSPVGLPIPEILAKDQKAEWGPETVRVLQEVAWEAVTQHPLSGVKDPVSPAK